MDSDDSYETTSEVSPDRETRFSSSSSHGSMNRNSAEIRDLYLSVFSGTEPNTLSLNTQLDALRAKLQEQTNKIQSLEGERTMLLEQKIQLYHSLEKKERELVKFMQSYEQKAKDIAQYMQEVQGLLAQLTDFFPDQFEEQIDINNPQLYEELVSGQPETTKNFNSKENTPNGSATHDCKLRGERGRDILRALSASVAAATASNRQSAVNQQAEQKGRMKPSDNKSEVSRINGHSGQGSLFSLHGNDTAAALQPTELPTNLPPFCWSTEQVFVWLSEYVCLPSGCLEAAKRCQLDGKQLTTLSEAEAPRLLRLTDPGLRLKLHLALEDLRVHGSPGVSRFPGPSHIRPDWVCNTWLKRHLGLTHLAPFFAVRCVDGRMLASLAVCGMSKHSNRRQTIKGNSELRLISAPQGGNTDDANTSSACPNTNFGEYGRGPSRRELYRILFGVNFDKSAEKLQSEGLSGADLPPTSKHLLGKYEARSLRAGLELLRRFTFDIELLERTRSCENRKDALLFWTNENVANWLERIGLREYTHGIDSTGLHGAYMVLDPTFNLNRLIKQLRIPATLAANLNLDEHLQTLLKPARLLQGMASKPRKLFRRRSTSRSTNSSIMQCSATSISNLELCGSSSPMIGGPGADGSRLPNQPASTTPGKHTESRLSRKPSWLSKNKGVRMTSVELNSVKQDSVKKSNLIKESLTEENEKQLTLNNLPNSPLYTRRISRILGTNRSITMASDTRPKPVRSAELLVNGSFEEEDRSGTLVRKTSISSTTDSMKSPLARMIRVQKSPSPNNQSGSRGSVKASDASMIDPFDQNVGQVRTRIMLFQNTHVDNPDFLQRTAHNATSTPPVKSSPSAFRTAEHRSGPIQKPESDMSTGIAQTKRFDSISQKSPTDSTISFSKYDLFPSEKNCKS